MHYPLRTLFLSSLLPSLFGNIQLVSGGRIPLLSNLIVRDDASSKTVDIPGLALFAKYVCPNAANNLKRQTSGFPVPKNQLQGILLQLQQMELAVISLIQEYVNAGELNSDAPSGVFVGPNGEQIVSISSPSTTIAIVSLSSVMSSLLSAMPTVPVNGSGACTYNISTTMVQSTITITAPTVTVSAFLPTGSNLSGAASSTSSTSSTTLTHVAAPSTAATESTAASPASGGVFLQTSAGSAAPTFTGGAETQSTGYTFNAQSSKNVAVYFGQTPVTGGTSLAAQCADPNIDIVILAFVISIEDGGQYPQVNFGAACGGQTAEMQSQAPGLLSCPELASDISTCQSKYGKKVLLSIGGSTSQISLPSPSSASTFATTLWHLFGPPGNVDVGLRPFGTTQIDGFDVDNEDNIPANWDSFAQTLRTLYSTAPKTYYISSAPQCPFPDASNPQALLLLCDFVWVQFYNNPQCQIGGPNFNASLAQWSTALARSTMAVKPRLYLGAPAFSAASTSAYASIGTAQRMESIVSGVKNMGLSNFGGVMFWDGPEGMLNTAGGKDILGWAKTGLNA